MNKQEAINAILEKKDLESKFAAAYDILAHSPPISQDKMLLLYAYYKQAKFGNYIERDTNNDVMNYIQTFKNNAWSQMNNLSKDEAKQKYIDFTLQVIEDNYKG